VIFSSENFGLFEYRHKIDQYFTLPILDEENLAEKMPKNFKTAFIGNETFLIVGGFDVKQGKTSKKVYSLHRGKITENIEMYKSRQFFPLILDSTSSFVYAIGGFNMKDGALD